MVVSDTLSFVVIDVDMNVSPVVPLDNNSVVVCDVVDNMGVDCSNVVRVEPTVVYEIPEIQNL